VRLIAQAQHRRHRAPAQLVEAGVTHHGAQLAAQGADHGTFLRLPGDPRAELVGVADEEHKVLLDCVLCGMSIMEQGIGHAQEVALVALADGTGSLRLARAVGGHGEDHVGWRVMVRTHPGTSARHAST
jgi:hypothetical protein